MERNNALVRISNDEEMIPHNMIAPPASQTETSIALVWDKPKKLSDIAAYQVYISGQVHGISLSTDYTVTGLAFGEEYEAFACAVLKSGELSLKSNTIKVKTKPKAEIFDITSYGAVGDGKTLNTEFIQKAIDECTHGGKVYVPKGTFLTGAVFLKSNMTLYI